VTLSGRARLALGALFFFSGVAALGVETTWMRWFRTLFGATAPAASATLVAFFTGHALGAMLAARWLPRLRRPLRAYGLLEIAAACFALAVPLLLAFGASRVTALYPLLAESSFLRTALRLTLAIAATAPAAACFGATLPVLGAAVTRSPEALGSTGSAFYGANTAGAALGTALVSFVLPDLLGVSVSYLVAAALSLAVGAGALMMGTLRAERSPPRHTPRLQQFAIAAASAQRSPSPHSRASSRSRPRCSSCSPSHRC
jgi:MFS family permease